MGKDNFGPQVKSVFANLCFKLYMDFWIAAILTGV